MGNERKVNFKEKGFLLADFKDAEAESSSYASPICKIFSVEVEWISQLQDHLAVLPWKKLLSLSATRPDNVQSLFFLLAWISEYWGPILKGTPKSYYDKMGFSFTGLFFQPNISGKFCPKIALNMYFVQQIKKD